MYNLIISIITTLLSVFLAVRNVLTANKSKRNTHLFEVVSKIPDFVTEAEQLFGAGMGSAKLSYVLRLIECACIQTGVAYDRSIFSAEVERVLHTPSCIKEVSYETTKNEA